MFRITDEEFNLTKKVDFLVIGAGIIGLSVALELRKSFPASSVLVVEKEKTVAEHASGRNSGVLHAGFYYSSDSLKAKFCRNGNLRLRQLINDNSIPLRETGKVVVAKNSGDLEYLYKLYERGIENGVEIKLKNERELNKYEPLAVTFKDFIWSPTTATSDPLLVSQVILNKLTQSGGEVLFSSEIDFKDGTTLVNGKPVEAGLIINSAGTGALKIAHKNAAGQHYSQLPILGAYKTTSSKNLGLRTLVYPVPNPKNPFLGVHFTVTVDGQIKIGPSAVPTLGREFYEIGDKFDFNDIASGIMSISAMTLKAFPVLSQLLLQELPKAQSRIILKEGEKLVPTAGNVGKWHKKRPGIRAQLIDLRTGQFEMDFKVEKNSNFIHILNAVSPGWTASIPFAEWIVSEYVN